MEKGGNVKFNKWLRGLLFQDLDFCDLQEAAARGGLGKKGDGLRRPGPGRDVFITDGWATCHFDLVNLLEVADGGQSLVIS